MQRCLSGLRSTIGNRVTGVTRPEVRILFSAPKKKERETLSFFYFKNKFSPLQSSVSVLPALGLFAMIYFASNVSARD